MFEGISSFFDENNVSLFFLSIWSTGYDYGVRIRRVYHFDRADGGFIFRLSQIYGALFKKVVE